MNPSKVIDCYNKTAKKYAEKYGNELEGKHLDKILLKAFAGNNKGRMIDLGCGPGQTTKFLFENGAINILGTDISSAMVKVAGELNPQISFSVADMLQLSFKYEEFNSAVAFYSIVHFTGEQLSKAFSEVNRILKPKGQFLFSFHIGDEIIHQEYFLDEKADIDFYFFEVEKVLELLKENNFTIIDVIQRHPYEGVEYPSHRAYITVEKK
ncbi:MAG: hypothetical protein K0S32_2519 [Bacteroidetes bacterium]|nr:hypothetical protein [Bacteroidota bacterium]